MKIALALGGGGAKGAYEVGVYEALLKLGIKIDLVTGTSIGSLNGALIAQGDFDMLLDLWSNITKDQVLSTLDYKNLSFDLNNLRKLVSLGNHNNEHNAIPLKKLIDRHLNEHRLRTSETDFGLVCVSFPSLKSLELTLNDIPEGKVADYLLASSSIFPAFPMCKIDGKLHIDGGYYDNLPIDLAINMGADFIIAVDLFTSAAHPEYRNCPIVKYIKPSRSLGPMLHFDTESIMQNKALGYNDTLKAFNKALGFYYSFRKKSFEGQGIFATKFAKNIYAFESRIPTKVSLHTKRIPLSKLVRYPLTNYIKMHTDGKQLSTEDFFIRGAEICMDILHIPPYKIYDLHNLNEILILRFLDKEKYDYKVLLKNMTFSSPTIDKEYLVGCILYRMLDFGITCDDIFYISMIFPKETTAAFYLYSIIN